MFCSATPALMNRARVFAQRLQRHESEIAGQKKIALLRASPTMASQNAFLMAPPELAQGDGVLLRAERQIMPLHAVLHERDAFALDGVQHDHRTGMRAHRAGDGAMIMAVDVHDRGAESFDAPAEVLHRGDFASAPEALQSIQIDEHRELRNRRCVQKISASHIAPSCHSPSEVRQ